MEVNLKPCPFCGGEAAINPTMFYTYPAVSVLCTSCRIRTVPVEIGDIMNYHRMEFVHTTAEQAEAKAIQRWNRRPEVQHGA